MSCRGGDPSRRSFSDRDLDTMRRHRHDLVTACVSVLLVVPALPLAAHAQTALNAASSAATTRLVTRVQPGPSDTWLFGRIQALTVDRNGRIYVLDATDQKIRVFSESGKPLRVLGGLGRGPGELLRPRTLDVVNDTLWVIDNANARLSAFSLDHGPLTRASPHGRSVVIVDRSPSTTGSSATSAFGARATRVIRVLEIGWRGDTLRSQLFSTPTRKLSAADVTALDGSVWLRQPQPPAKPAMFWRIAADGKVLAPVALPSSIRPFRVTRNRVWGVAENELGEPVVEVHDVVDPVTSPPRTPQFFSHLRN